MASRETYNREIGNGFLRLRRTVSAHTQWELTVAAQEQLRRWDETEVLLRARERVDDPVLLAKLMSTQVQKAVEAYGHLLTDALRSTRLPDWESTLRRETYPLFAFPEPEPSEAYYLAMYAVPNKRFFGLLGGSKRERQAREAQARLSYERAVEVYNVSRNAAFSSYKAKKREYDVRQKNHNDSVDRWRAQVAQGDGLAVEKYLRVVLAMSRYPGEVVSAWDVFYDPILRTAVVAFRLPLPQELPSQREFRCDEGSGRVVPVPMEAAEQAAFYEGVASQMALRVIHELFFAIASPATLQAVALNGWVSADSAGGRNNILAVRTLRSSFERLDLVNLPPEECLRRLGASAAGPLANLTPVEPLLEPRSQAAYRPQFRDTVLAAMPWDGFQRLMVEFLDKVFAVGRSQVEPLGMGLGGEMQAVARSTDPTQPGEVLIRARKGAGPIGVSDCERLYEDMVVRGAARCVLITAGGFPEEVWEYARNMPITLVDGPNLAHMLNEYGCIL